MASQSNSEAAGPGPPLTPHLAPGGQAFWALWPPFVPPGPALPTGSVSVPRGVSALVSLICTKPLPRLGMAWPLATRTAKPVLELVHSPRGHSELAPNAASVLCPHRCPRQPPTSWPTARPTSGRTRSSSPCLRQKTPTERRSSSAPSSDCFVMKHLLLSVTSVGTRMLVALGASPPVPAQPRSQGKSCLSLGCLHSTDFTFSFHFLVIFIIGKEKKTFLESNNKCAK